MVYLFLVNLTEVLTIISALTGFIGLAVSLLNIRLRIQTRELTDLEVPHKEDK
ncbi:MAG: hypothetical protein NZL86_03210 [Aquificaceae bacterium]|nr:hypothetical protein [Aquificaceae bacterium]